MKHEYPSTSCPNSMDRISITIDLGSSLPARCCSGLTLFRLPGAVFCLYSFCLTNLLFVL